jgi:hypothetical protein
MKASPRILILALLLATPPIALAQRSPVQDLLATARLALNDLRFPDADSILRGVLSYDLRRSDRIQALQLFAGALFPEQETAQQRDRAVAALRELVRIAPSAGLPREVSWAGLESLLAEVRAATFGAAVTVRESYVLTGPAERADIEVLATQPSRFLVRLTPRIGGTQVLTDSLVGVNRGTIPLRVLAEGQPRFPTGDYYLTVVAISLVAVDTVALRFEVSVEAPRIDYVAVPEPLDEATLLPEVTRPRRVLGIVGGMLMAAGTVAASRLLRDREIKDRAGADSRAVPIGITLGAAAAVGTWLLDHGEPIPANISANRETRTDHQRRIQEAREMNAMILRNYQAEITINPEPIR